MPKDRIEEDTRLTFSDEDFERRYSTEQTSSSAPPPPRPVSPVAAQVGRSRNRFMRTLIRRRLASAGAA
jgi:hypothetical protein